MDLDDLRAARWRCARTYARTAKSVFKLLEADPDAVIYGTVLEMAAITAWTAFSNADSAYRKAKEAQVDEG